MERARAASRGDQGGAELPVEPLENQVPGPEQSQAPAEERPLESSESTEATGAGQDQSGEKKLPSPRPAHLRVLPPSLGYGAFRPGAEHGLGAEGGKESPGSPTCRCKEQEREEDTVLLHCKELAGDEKLHRAIKLMGLPMYIKCLHWALAVMAVLLAVSAVANVVLASRTGAGWQQPCPQDWLWSGEHCYYFSTEAQAWEASQAFCSAHQATLPLLSHTQGFLARYLVIKNSWVGAVMGPEGWHWIDGTTQRLPEEDDDQLALKCGSLEGGKLVALDCTSSRPWICAKGTK
ncbi:PREDICTED: killer cell lectin-like receptor subfamily G member 2 [Miniopterus natalensis]|uniref:killer cell lectin-like receptor subfamily G member 2 n=1 Tax=Miniopterus natalensis TaxID=291302 RepID=UPI0007A6D878|nr:PREDICTED: killer cell lectin-like receptor subfamily G member 2 [Miniopterus natalensis]